MTLNVEETYIECMMSVWLQKKSMKVEVQVVIVCTSHTTRASELSWKEYKESCFFKLKKLFILSK